MCIYTLAMYIAIIIMYIITPLQLLNLSHLATSEQLYESINCSCIFKTMQLTHSYTLATSTVSCRYVTHNQF